MFLIIHLVSLLLCIYGKKSKGGSTIVITSNGCGCSSKGNEGKLVVTSGDKKEMDNIIINNKADECCEKSWPLPETSSIHPLHQFIQMPLPKFPPVMPSFYPYNPLLFHPLNQHSLLFSEFHNLKSWDNKNGKKKSVKTASPKDKIDQDDNSKKIPTFIPAPYFHPFVNLLTHSHPPLIYNVLPSNYRHLPDSHQLDNLHPLFIPNLAGMHSWNPEILKHHIEQIEKNRFEPLTKSHMFNMNPNIYHFAEVDELNDKIPQVEYILGLKKYRSYNQHFDRYSNRNNYKNDEIEFPSVNYDSINDKRKRERMSEQVTW